MSFASKQEKVTDEPPWNYNLVLYTSRKPVHFRGNANFRHISYYEAQASEALNYAENQR